MTLNSCTIFQNKWNKLLNLFHKTGRLCNMNTGKIATEYRMTQWAHRIQERKISGISIKGYCEKNGLSRDSYYYWQRKLREAVCEQLPSIQSSIKAENLIPTRFAEVQIQPDQGNLKSFLSQYATDGNLIIEVSGFKMTANYSYPAEQLIHLLKELVDI